MAETLKTFDTENGSYELVQQDNGRKEMHLEHNGTPIRISHDKVLEEHGHLNRQEVYKQVGGHEGPDVDKYWQKHSKEQGLKPIEEGLGEAAVGGAHDADTLIIKGGKKLPVEKIVRVIGKKAKDIAAAARVKTEEVTGLADLLRERKITEAQEALKNNPALRNALNEALDEGKGETKIIKKVKVGSLVKQRDSGIVFKVKDIHDARNVRVVNLEGEKNGMEITITLSEDDLNKKLATEGSAWSWAEKSEAKTSEKTGPAIVTTQKGEIEGFVKGPSSKYPEGRNPRNGEQYLEVEVTLPNGKKTTWDNVNAKNVRFLDDSEAETKKNGIVKNGEKGDKKEGAKSGEELTSPETILRLQEAADKKYKKLLETNAGELKIADHPALREQLKQAASEHVVDELLDSKGVPKDKWELYRRNLLNEMKQDPEWLEMKRTGKTSPSEGAKTPEKDKDTPLNRAIRKYVGKDVDLDGPIQFKFPGHDEHPYIAKRNSSDELWKVSKNGESPTEWFEMTDEKLLGLMGVREIEIKLEGPKEKLKVGDRELEVGIGDKAKVKINGVLEDDWKITGFVYKDDGSREVEKMEVEKQNPPGGYEGPTKMEVAAAEFIAWNSEDEVEEEGYERSKWQRIKDFASGRTALAAFNSRAAKEESSSDTSEKKKRLRRGVVVGGLALIGAGAAAYFATKGIHIPHGTPHIPPEVTPGPHHGIDQVDWGHGAFHPNQFGGLDKHGNPLSAVDSVKSAVNVFRENGYEVHHITDQQAHEVLNDMVKENLHVAFGMNADGSQHIMSAAQGYEGGHAANYLASNLQGFERVGGMKHGSSVENWHKFANILTRHGISILKRH